MFSVIFNGICQRTRWFWVLVGSKVNFFFPWAQKLILLKCNCWVLKVQLTKLLNLYVATVFWHYPFLQIFVRYLLIRSIWRYRFLRQYGACLCQVELCNFLESVLSAFLKKMCFKTLYYFSPVKFLGITYSARYFLTVCEGCIHFDQRFLIFIAIFVVYKQKINFPWNTSSFFSSFRAWLWKCFLATHMQECSYSE